MPAHRKQRSVLLFADRLPPLVGGMEMHARYFIEHFATDVRFPLGGVVTRDALGRDCLAHRDDREPIDLAALPERFEPAIVFFNSGRWIEDLPRLRAAFPEAAFVYRTGGNEIVKAPLERAPISEHAARQAFWTNVLNSTIDLLITNSAFTESRLRALGLRCAFARCVGGVNTVALQSVERPDDPHTTFFCAARFVPYKNHALMLDVVRALASRALDVRVRLAGDGPLLDDTRARVRRLGLEDRVAFLGVLDNEAVCHEIARADIYLQLSADQLTEVPGGTYLHAEGMGRSILEAISAGTFVVAGRSGALPEVVTQTRGLLVDLDDAGAIADQVERLLRAPRRRPASTDEYAWARVFGRYEQLWEALDATARRH
ncbi:MAG: glycosyltransferase [Polyangiales bacterium]